MKAEIEPLAHLRRMVADRLGIDANGPRAESLDEALRALGKSGLRGATWSDVAGRLRSLPLSSAEWQRIAAAATVGETYFFRDEPLFRALKSSILPLLIARRRGLDRRSLRIWSAGCASGEEPYSIAIVLDTLLPNRDLWSVTILATDIHVHALNAARRGTYRSWSMRGVPESIETRYFRKHGGTFDLDPRIRSAVFFAPLNLASPEYPDPLTDTTCFDLIFCRNVLMYLTASAQRDVARRLTAALAPGGFLATSPAEASSELFRTLVPMSVEGAILYQNIEAQPAKAPAVLPNPHRLAAPRRMPRSAIPSPQPAPVARAVSASSVPPLARARALADRGCLEEAAEVCRTAVALDRLDVEAHLLAAEIAQERGLWTAAFEHARHAAYLAPAHPLPHFLLGALSLRTGRRPQAIRSFRTALQLLSAREPGAPVEHAGGLTVALLRETAQSYVEMAHG